MTSDGTHVEIDARPFLKKMKQLEPEAYKAFGKATRPIVAKVRNAVRDAMPSRTGTARKAIVSGSTQRDVAFVKMNKTGKNVYVPWLDFGGTLRPSGRRYNTIERSRPSADGRWLYPIAKAAAPETQDALERAWAGVVRAVDLN